jgi:RNA polymerase sigma-70 factor (ECF subfamily)
MTMADLAAIFREAAGAETNPIAGDRLAAACARGHASHPDLALDDSTFVRHLAHCLAHRDDPLPVLEELIVGDLFLACACLHDVSGAAAAFDAQCGPAIRAGLAGVHDLRVERDEIEQQLRVRLMIGTEAAPPRLKGYLGVGPLARWASVAAQRLAISALRSNESEASARERSAIEAAIDWKDPDVVLLKERYRADFQQALLDAMSAISDHDRLLLRLQLVNGLSARSLGKMYNVDHSTAARWLQDIRARIGDAIQHLLRERLKLTSSEVQSIAALMSSQLDLSISRLLQTGPGGDQP